jgi:transposase/IS30 family transposase
MSNSLSNKITDWARFFLEPGNSTQRQYEALRAYFVEGLSSKEAAERFGYTQGSFRVLVHQFRQNPRRRFFIAPKKGPHKAPKRDNLREQVIALRKQNHSIYDISKCLETKRRKLSPGSVSIILKEEGFARLPRRRDEERPPATRPTTADVADVRQLDLTPRQVHTKFGGLFLFVPFLAAIDFDKMLVEARLPGSKMIPAGYAIRSLLALKLFASGRHSHVMSYVLDEGLALFAGLNAIPKRAFLTEYSCRIDPRCYPRLMRLWFDAMGNLGLERGLSFDLDFHTIPFHGEDALVQKHYVSKRSRRQKGILAFVAQDASTQVFCYGNADVRKEDQNDEMLNFVQFWKQRTGHFPQELIFDSKLTTYNNLNQLNHWGVDFITLRSRSRKMLDQVHKEPVSKWRRIELDGVSRIYRTPRVLDTKISIKHYEGPIRQLVIAELGHEEPTFLLTNQLTRSASTLIKRYSQRMIIENNIADSIDFFHMDALSSAVAMKVNLDLQLTLMASSLYRLLGSKLGNGYQKAKSRHIFRDFIDATAKLTIREKDIFVRFQKRAHNPFLISADFHKIDIPVSWLGRKRMHFLLG